MKREVVFPFLMAVLLLLTGEPEGWEVPGQEDREEKND